MPTAYQIEKIEDLSRGELDDLIIKIFSKQEFESIELLEDCIKAKQRECDEELSRYRKRERRVLPDHCTRSKSYNRSL